MRTRQRRPASAPMSLTGPWKTSPPGSLNDPGTGRSHGFATPATRSIEPRSAGAPSAYPAPTSPGASSACVTSSSTRPSARASSWAISKSWCWVDPWASIASGARWFGRLRADTNGCHAPVGAPSTPTEENSTPGPPAGFEAPSSRFRNAKPPRR